MTPTGQIGTVAELWRYPVSSLAGELLGSSPVTSSGILGDRRFGIIDAETGEPGKPDADARWHKLPLIQSRLTGNGLEIALPDQPWLPAPHYHADAALSDFLGFAVALLPFSREAAPDHAGPLTQARYEVAPLHLLTTASLARLKALHPSGEPDRRRFRPNIVIEMPAIEGHFPETEWIGRRLAVGGTELTISEPCRRCGFTIIAQGDLPDDPEILRQLLRNNQRNIGVYCTVDRPAEIIKGAPVRLLA